MELNVLEQVVQELEKAKVECQNSIVAKQSEDNSQQITNKEEELKAIMLAELEVYKNDLIANHDKELADMNFELKVIEKLIGKKNQELELAKAELITSTNVVNQESISTPLM